MNTTFSGSIIQKLLSIPIDKSRPFLLLCLLIGMMNEAHGQFDYIIYEWSITITGYTGTNGTIIIPTNINGLTVTTIADEAFAASPAFGGDAVPTSITIPDTVTTTGDQSFGECNMLTNISIPASLTNIGNFMLIGCSRLTSVTIPAGITTLGFGEFCATGLTSVTIPDGVTNLTDYAFCQCGDLTNVTIPNSVTHIGEFEFYADPLPSVTLPGSVNYIGGSAYYLCKSLTNVTIPASVNHINGQAFAYCYILTNVFFQGNAPSTGGGAQDGPVFYDDASATVYYLPGTTGWSNTFEGVPAVLWNPLIQTGNGNFGVQNNQFGFDITGTTNIPIVVEASTNLANPVWTR
jgi:hypothetical protein